MHNPLVVYLCSNYKLLLLRWKLAYLIFLALCVSPANISSVLFSFTLPMLRFVRGSISLSIPQVRVGLRGPLQTNSVIEPRFIYVFRRAPLKTRVKCIRVSNAVIVHPLLILYSKQLSSLSSPGQAQSKGPLPNSSSLSANISKQLFMSPFCESRPTSKIGASFSFLAGVMGAG